jgi:hypothetical protein
VKMASRAQRHWRYWPCLSALALLVAACGGAIAPSPAPPGYHSATAHLQVALPPGWAAAEGPTQLARPFEGWVAFNSWGQAGFWAPELARGHGLEYNDDTVMQQMPAGGAYIVLVNENGGPMPLLEDYVDYAPADLGGVWHNHDCRSAAGGETNWHNFSKWGYTFILAVYCQPTASDATAAAVNALLDSWRFDRAPAAEVAWAVVTARALLPASVDPNQFPLISGPPRADQPPASLTDQDDVERTTQVLSQGAFLEVIFTLHWSGTAPGQHTWHYQARPTGEVVLLEESGDPLPPTSQ